MASRIVGIDLGAYSVKVAIATPGFRHAALQELIERRVPDGDEPHDVRAARVVGEIVREHDLQHDTAYAAMSGDRVFTHVLEFAFKNLRRPDLERAVGAELEGILPIDLEDMVYAFEPLPRDGEAKAEDGVAAVVAAGVGPVAPPTEGMRVLACATHKERVERLLEVLGDVDAEPRSLLAAPAIYPAVLQRMAAVSGPVAIVDIGHERTDVCVVVQGRTAYVRTIARGGRLLTEAIARVWRMSFEQAESAKHTDGFVASANEPAQSEAWARIHDALLPELSPLARDLRQTLSACRAKTGITVENVLLVGGGSRLRGLPSYLAQELGVPTGRLSDADSAAILGPRLGVSGAADIAWLAAGVVFEGASGRPTFDLRQGEMAFKADLSFLRARLTQLTAAALVLIAFAAGNAYTSLYKLRKNEAALAQRLAVESAEAFGKQLSAGDVLDRIQPTGDGKSDSPLPAMTAYDLLLAFNAALPARSEVTIDVGEIDIKPGKVVVRATSSPSGQVGALTGVEAVETALKKNKCFADIATESQPGANDTAEFTLTIKTECM
jgi:general secretion pathway protein L